MTTTEAHIYPIGRFTPPTIFSDADRIENISRIEKLPSKLLDAIQALPSHCWEKSYRENGWNARQIVHHLADSHINALIRFKLALSEDNPVIKPYDQDKFAEISDSTDLDPMISFQIIEGVHKRLVYVLKHMSHEDFNKSYVHPEYNRIYHLHTVLALYAWHGEHHTAQLNVIRTIYG